MIITIFFSIAISCLFHEIGHLIMIIFFNIKCHRPWAAFSINFCYSKIYIEHDIFDNPAYNMLVALIGPIFPTIASSILVLSNLLGNFSGIIFLVSLSHVIFLLPIFTDGKNVKRYLN